MTEIWSQKYRPALLNDMIGRDDIVAQFMDWGDHIAMQNFLFYSQEAGTGKTLSLIHISEPTRPY